MNRQPQARNAACLAIVIAINIPISAVASTQLVPSPKRGLATKDWDGKHQFTLNLALFKDKKDAEAYQKKMRGSISAPIYVSYISKSDRYAVVVGPIKSLDLLHTTSRQALKVSSAVAHPSLFGFLSPEKQDNKVSASTHRSVSQPSATKPKAGMTDQHAPFGFLFPERKEKTGTVSTKLISSQKHGLATEKRDGKHQFTLTLAVFKDKKDAEAFQKRMKDSISAPVYVSHLSKSNRYAVVVVPINRLDLLHATRRQALKRPAVLAEHDKPQVAWSELGQNSWITHQQSGKNVVSTTKKHTRPLGHRNIPVNPLKRSLTTIQPGPYVGMTTGPIVNTSGSPATYGGWQGAGFAGLGGYISQTYPWFYLGAEITGLNSARLGHAKAPLSPSVQSGWSYSFDAIPGILINDHTMGYFRIGGMQTRFSHTLNTLDHLGRQISLPGRNEAAWEFGVGLQAKFFRHIEARLEYVFDDYIDERHALPGRLKVYGNRVGAGVVYKFYDEPEMKK